MIIINRLRFCDGIILRLSSLLLRLSLCNGVLRIFLYNTRILILLLSWLSTRSTTKCSASKGSPNRKASF